MVKAPKDKVGASPLKSLNSNIITMTKCRKMEFRTHGFDAEYVLPIAGIVL
jgi:hypothetical protein